MTAGERFDLSQPRRIHLVGVGGAGMSAIARSLIQLGHLVSGSDRQEGRALEGLRAMGATIQIGHDSRAITDAEAVVISTAIRPSNPEVVAARRSGIPVLHRSEMLAALMAGQRAILIAGTHGKTTTTSMTVVALQAAGADPSFAIGGTLNEVGANAHAGTGELFVAEADESDRSFLVYRPDVAVVTNVELDHPDAFRDLEEIEAAFRTFLRRRDADAPALLCADDPGARRLGDVGGAVVTYGQDPHATFRLVPVPGRTSRQGATGAGSTPAPLTQAARLRFRGRDLVDFSLAVPGRHNLLNAAAALTVCHLLGVNLEAAAAGLASFTGVQRRFQRLGMAAEVEVVDDYAHHPTELRATLAAARSVSVGRVVLVVQPHRFSRTSVLGPELGRAAAGADLVVVTDVYGADEQPVPGVSGEIVAAAAREAGAKVVWQPHLGDVPGTLASLVEPGDLVVVTGAGDVSQVGPALLTLLRGGDVR
ncbi:MAG: UDP-N-acetylmuramate--L-alanine ligase [Actinomycetota bacterium]|nr:UDP-N-acetylmuramate--L-alanine ligase [Actinomycetota bacterium]